MVAQNVSFMLVRQILNRDTGLWLDELKKILFRMINTACLSFSGACVCEREKWCHGTCGCMQGISKAEMFCSTFLCVPYTHTCLSYHFHPVTMICGGEILHALSTCLATATATSSTPQQAARRAAGFGGSCCCPFKLLNLSLTAVKPAKISHTLRLWF